MTTVTLTGTARFSASRPVAARPVTVRPVVASSVPTSSVPTSSVPTSSVPTSFVPGSPVATRSMTESATSTAPSRSSRLRLTRRGRAVLLVLVTVPLAIAALLMVLNGGGAIGTAQSGTTHYVTVQAGESLWQVAQQIAPTADPREVVTELSTLNELESSQVQPGQRLAIPSRYDN